MTKLLDSCLVGEKINEKMFYIEIYILFSYLPAEHNGKHLRRKRRVISQKNRYEYR